MKYNLLFNPFFLFFSVWFGLVCSRVSVYVSLRCPSLFAVLRTFISSSNHKGKRQSVRKRKESKKEEEGGEEHALIRNLFSLSPFFERRSHTRPTELPQIFEFDEETRVLRENKNTFLGMAENKVSVRSQYTFSGFLPLFSLSYLFSLVSEEGRARQR